MLRMKTLLLLAVTTTTLVFAGCNGTGEAESSNNGVGATPSADTTPPSMPTGLTVTAAGSTGANLSWNASTDNVGVTGYIVSRDGIEAGTTATTTYAETGLSPGVTYSYSVAARDAAGNRSHASPNANFNIADTTPPTTPTDRKSTRLNSSHSQISYAVFCLKK